MLKRLIFLALVAAAAWYGYKNYDKLVAPKGGDFVVVNHSGRAVERLRVSVGSQTEVVEVLEDGATIRRAFQPQREGVFHLVWSQRGVLGERSWTGGTASAGTEFMTHRFEFGSDNSVIWTSELKAK